MTVINSKFDYRIYIKPTQTETIIPYDSNHPISQMITYFKSIFNRSERIPLSKHYYQHELNIVYDVD